MFGAGEPAEDAADAFAAAQVMQAAVKAVGGIDDQTKLADWIRSHSVNTILGPLKWDKTGAPQGQFLDRPVAERQVADRAAEDGSAATIVRARCVGGTSRKRRGAARRPIGPP